MRPRAEDAADGTWYMVKYSVSVAPEKVHKPRSVFFNSKTFTSSHLHYRQVRRSIYFFDYLLTSAKLEVLNFDPFFERSERKMMLVIVIETYDKIPNNTSFINVYCFA